MMFLKTTAKRVITLLLCLMLVLPSFPTSVWGQETGGLTTEQPVLLISGDELIDGGTYSAGNISNEKSYTLAELKALDSITYTQRYSALNTFGTKRMYIGEGVDVAGLLALSGYTVDHGGELAFMASDRSALFDSSTPLNNGRYYYPNLGAASGEDADSDKRAALLAWKSAYKTVPETPELPSDDNENPLRLLVGQTSIEDVNNSLFNQEVKTIQAGEALTDTSLTVNGTVYTRAQLLMMPRAEYTHTAGTSGTKVRGVPLAILIKDLDNDAGIDFQTADSWEGISAYNGMSKSELIDKNAILAYEVWDDANRAWKGYYRNGPYLRLWIDGLSGAHAVNAIKESAPAENLYKHINYQGAPYNLDAITSATLTVEGPGVEAGVPISVRELEETNNVNIYRGGYSDALGKRIYEGVILQAILDSKINTNVKRLDDKVNVVFKNRWRQEIGRLSYAEIKDAATPLIMAYGVANADETNIQPFVFTMAAGEDTTLGNGDGPLKLVYDRSEFPALADMNKKFASVAYIYIEEGTPPPGFKHTGAKDDAYSNVANTEYLITFTGEALGREVSFTVAELEDMVVYDGDKPQAGGPGHRAEYGLSNTTYWYVNEYEGVKLWDLLTNIGVDANTYKDDQRTLVSFSAWDNYQISAQFSMYQLANPDLFYFYEKSPLDIGTDRPTKSDLATEDYWPDNQGEGWRVDENGYPVKKGYPVMLAYGVNGYPYVRSSVLDGFKSGLGNDGGPMRVIYGKADGLNRSNPDALDNYAYFFNNGSEQLKRVQEVYVGEPVRYSTHMENPDPAYQAMKDQAAALTVEIISAGSTQVHSFTLAELESILYGPEVSKPDRDDESRQEKGYYYYKDSGGNQIQDLFEGVNLEYLLMEHIGLQGTLGTVEMYSGDSSSPAATYELTDIGNTGQNSLRGTDGLGMMVAFAKNGYPLVAGGGNTPGYVSTDKATGQTIKNSGGPLQYVRGQTNAEYVSDSIDNTDTTKTSVENLTRIVVNLDPDTFAHVGAEYESAANQNILFSGEVALKDGVNIKVGALETMQKYMVTDTYTVGGVNKTYRGLDLYRLLNDKAIGASALMNEVTVKNAAADSTTLTIADLAKDGKKIILAYGTASTGDLSDATPLTAATGGPLRLIIDGGTEAECIVGVNEIAVSAASIDAWKHNFGQFEQYAGYKLEISGKNLKNNKTYTVAEVEAMDNILVFDSYQMDKATYIQGVDLYKLLQNIGFAEGLETSDFTATAADGFGKDFSGAQLKDGINGKPILVAFGQGTEQANGLPLVPETTSPGYNSNVENAYGPLRLIVHENNGWCVKYLSKIVVGAAGGTPEDPPAEEKDFNIYGLAAGTASYDIKAIKNLPDSMGKNIATYSYTASGEKITDTVKGAYLYDLLKTNGVGDSALITINATDGYEKSQADYCDISMSEIKGMKYFVAYDTGPDENSLSAVSDSDEQTPPVTATVRIYRNYNDGSNWRNRLTKIKGVTVEGYTFNTYQLKKNGFPNAGVRSISFDADGGMWVGTYGGGLAYLPAEADTFTVYGTASTPPLKTNYASAVAADSTGGIWFSQNASYTSPGDNRGVGYLKKDGTITYYDTSDSPATIPNNYVQAIQIDSAGNVWFGSFGGITKFDGTNWKTWTKDNGLPAESVNTIVFDNAGGVWIGCYPDTVGSTEIQGSGPADTYAGGYAHINAAGEIDFTKKYEAGQDDGIEAHLLADFWVRGMAVDDQGGAWIVRSGSYVEMANVGGRVDYVDKDKKITTYTGKELLGESALSDLAIAPEIRMVAVDKNGGLWFATSGAGLFHCTEPGTVHKVYNAANKAWPAGTPMDNIYYLKFFGDTLYAGGSGGIAWADVALAPSAGTVTVLDPPFTIKQNGKADIAWAIGGSGNSIKNLPENAGKEEKTYQYDGADKLVRGAYLNTILASSGISGSNMAVTITTTDGFSRDNYQNLTLAEIRDKNYFLAYDIYNADSGAWDKIADVDKNNVQASLRIYRVFDNGDSGEKNNEIKSVSGLTVRDNTGGSGLNYVGDATETTAELKITGAVEKPGYFTRAGLKTYQGVTERTRTYNWKNAYGTTGQVAMTGVYLEDLLENVMQLKTNAGSVTVAADDYYREFNLDTKDLGVYWTDHDGNKLMLAWQENGADCSLRLVVGQTGSDHENRPMWVRDVVSITVNANSVRSGSGTAGSYESSKKTEELSSKTSEEETIDNAAIPLAAYVTIEDGLANATSTADEVRSRLAAANDKSAELAAAGKILQVNAQTKEDSVKTIYTLPDDALRLLTADAQTTLQLLTNQGGILLNAELLKYLDSNGQGPLTIEIETVNSGEPGDLAAVDITIRRGDTVITTFNHILLKVDIPLNPESPGQEDGLTVYHIDENGQKTLIKLASYDSSRQNMRVGLWHLSQYTIGYNPITFADIQGHWGQSQIEFLASRHIVSGRAADTFSPDSRVTRAEFVKMLAELADAANSVLGSVNADYSDVGSGAWYSGYVNWAASLGIVQGYTDGTFRPDELITREQMAAITERFVRVVKFDLKTVEKASEFTDQDQIASYAIDAIRAVQQYGIINGYPDSSFDPKGSASRAEAAVVTRALIEAILK